MSDTAPPAARRAGRRPAGQVIPRPVNLRIGAPAPWANLTAEHRNRSVDQVAAALDRAPRPRRSTLEGTGVRASAVLAPMYERDGEAVLILTRRAAHLRSHRGEVSFPGGGREPGDIDLTATALREASEEVHLDPDLVEVVGELDHLQTVTSGSFIIPFVGRLAQRPELEASPGEVEAILHVPLSELLDPDAYHEELWGLAPLEHRISFFELEDDTLWGATAAMVRNLLELVTATGTTSSAATF